MDGNFSIMKLESKDEQEPKKSKMSKFAKSYKIKDLVKDQSHIAGKSVHIMDYQHTEFGPHRLNNFKSILSFKKVYAAIAGM